MSTPGHAAHWVLCDSAIFKEPGNIASVAVIVALVCVGIASGAAYYNHSPDKLAAR